MALGAPGIGSRILLSVLGCGWATGEVAVLSRPTCSLDCRCEASSWTDGVMVGAALVMPMLTGGREVSRLGAGAEVWARRRYGLIYTAKFTVKQQLGDKFVCL